MEKKQPSEKQKAYWDMMRATGGWKAMGSQGGKRALELAGSEGMAQRGQLGGLKLVENLGGRENAKEYFSRIARIKGKKEDKT